MSRPISQAGASAPLASPSQAKRHHDVSIPLALTPHTSVQVRVTSLEKCLMVLCTSASPESSGKLAALGSFVYAMPNKHKPAEPLSTPLVTVPYSLDFATRIARILAKKMAKPVYVGCSIVLPGAMVEEEVEAMKAVVQAVVAWDEGKEGEKG